MIFERELIIECLCSFKYILRIVQVIKITPKRFGNLFGLAGRIV